MKTDIFEAQKEHESGKSTEGSIRFDSPARRVGFTELNRLRSAATDWRVDTRPRSCAYRLSFSRCSYNRSAAMRHRLLHGSLSGSLLESPGMRRSRTRSLLRFQNSLAPTLPVPSQE